jgi:sugar lactone lactonase YvrE
VSLLAGGSSFGNSDGTGAAATFSSPAGLCMDASETAILVADNLNHRIRRVDISTGTVTYPSFCLYR